MGPKDSNEDLPLEPLANGCKCGDESVRKLDHALKDQEPDCCGGEYTEDHHTILPMAPIANTPAASMLIYGVTDNPSWVLSCLLGLQHFLLFFGGIVSLPLILEPNLCIAAGDYATPLIISTMFFVSGINTFIQTVFGVRLPIVQGGTFAFLGPSLAILALPQWKCPDMELVANMTRLEKDDLWQSRMRELQGAIIMASSVEVLIGFTGAIGFLLRFIGPLTIVPTIAVTGLSLFPAASFWAGKHWGIAFLVIVVVTFFSQYAPQFKYRCFSPRTNERIRYLFQMFPVLIAVIIAWSVCAILTATNSFPAESSQYGYRARTDIKLAALSSTPWFRVPYPFQWGLPTFSWNGVGLISGVLAGIVESVGDYYACARLAGIPPPPAHAVSRAIGLEGLGCILAGMWGTGSGTTSYAENIAALGITKVGSRRVIVCASVIMIFIGVFSKFGGLMATMPDPIVGGLYCGIFGMITAVGLSQLHTVDLDSSRNLFVLGFSIFMSFAIPDYMSKNPGVLDGATGVRQIDQIFQVLLTTHMFLAGFIACLLDNTIPGSLRERGILSFEEQIATNETAASREIYDLPFGLTEFFASCRCSKYIPFIPKYELVLTDDKLAEATK